VRGVFVTGTGTGVGKSVLAAVLCAALAARGERVAAFKPVVTGLDDPVDAWPRDHELLAAAAGSGQTPEEVAPVCFGPPVSPHLAAELAGVPIEPAELVAHARSLAAEVDVLVAEGVGGLLVPITPGYLIRDLALELGLPVVIASHPALGAINHSLLTIEAARAAGLRVAGVVLTPWPDEPGDVELSNLETIGRLGDTRVDVLPPTTPADLAGAAAGLPIDYWLAI
jgi:dethiobiotin synthetase